MHRLSMIPLPQRRTEPGASLQAIETAIPDKFSRLFGSMTWTSEEVLSGEVLAAVMQAMDRTPKMHEGNMSHDVLGGAYEYPLKRFSGGSGTCALTSQPTGLLGFERNSGPLVQEAGEAPPPKRIAYRSFDRQWVLPDHWVIDCAQTDLWHADRLPHLPHRAAL